MMNKKILLLLLIFLVVPLFFVFADMDKENSKNSSNINIIIYRSDSPNYYTDKGIIYTEYENLKCNITFSHNSEIKIEKQAHGFEFSYILDMPDVSITPTNKFEPEIVVSCNGNLNEKNNVFYFNNFILDFTTLKKEVNISEYSDSKSGKNELISFDISTAKISDFSYKILLLILYQVFYQMNRSVILILK